MADYQELYYASQRKITDTIQVLEQEIKRLKQFQRLCEEKVIESDIDLKRNDKITEKEAARSLNRSNPEKK